MKLIISHPTGNANVRVAAVACEQADILADFYTCIATFDGTLEDRLSTIGPLSELNRRRFDNRLAKKTSIWPWQELGRIISSKVGLKNFTKHEQGIFSVDAVYHGLDKRIASQLASKKNEGVTAVYAYEDGALATFKAAKNLGLECIYDLPIGYWRAARDLLKAEQERWPEWAGTITGFRDSEAKLVRKDEELKLADRIFVASSFTKKTLSYYPAKLASIEVIPYGFPPVTQQREYPELKNRALKVLFVGGLSQRKGIADLFAAVRNIGKGIELTIVGQKTNSYCAALDTCLKEHRWIPSLSHAEILALMREHDVFVFPSLFEGFGLVITEAMSQGTPVITTDRTAGPDLITDGVDGWIIEAGSTKALQQALEQLLAQPERIASAGKAAMETAKRRPWSVYGKELTDAISGKI
jgi:glycosyltransferase involved in cell wall biosynthesis